VSAPHRPREWIVFGPGYSGLGKTRGVKAARADLDFAEQLAEVNAPNVQCGSHAEEWDGRINRCVLNDDHLGYHTDGCLLWSDMTALAHPHAPTEL
jgi:hypothetical protein